jgi:hypothetical protein
MSLSEYLTKLEALQSPAEFWVAKREPAKGKWAGWSSWLHWKDWKIVRQDLPNYRGVLQTELVAETDYPKQETNREVSEEIRRHYRKASVGFDCWFTGSKSDHIHTLFPNLHGLEPQVQKKAKKLFHESILPKAICDDIDESNYGHKTLIQIEGATNIKTGKESVLIESYGNWKQNTIPEEIIKEAKKVPVKTFSSVKKINIPNKCLLLEYACENTLPISERNIKIVPNLVAYTNDKEAWQRCADAQGKNLSEFETWAERSPKFYCSQMRKYAEKEKIKLGHLCSACLLGGYRNG